MHLVKWEVYLVGGAVRDQLLGKPVKERDWVVVGATPAQMRGAGFKQVGKDFPVFLHPETGEEYALARTERKTAKGYTGFACDADPSVTLEEDLLRRDLTINAIAMDTTGRIIDPWGGVNDLHARVLRHVSPAFVEDPVRLLRIARFLARYANDGFQIAIETEYLLLQMVRNGEVDALTPERVWNECVKALQETQPAAFVRVLRKCGALAVLFPEIDALFGVPNTARWHPEVDSGLHTLLVLEQAARLSDIPHVRFAALIHDLGKAVTPLEEWPSHHSHDARGVPIIDVLCDRLRVPRHYADLAKLVSREHIHVSQSITMKASALIRLLERVDAFRKPERFEQLLLVCQADTRGRTGHEDDDYPPRSYLQNLYEIAAAVDIKPILESGYQGSDIKTQLRKARIAAIKPFVERFHHEENF